jgi:hypothetical protein
MKPGVPVDQSSIPVLSSAFGLGGTAAVPSFEQLTDVDMVGITDGQIAVWDAGTSTWVPNNITPSGAFETVISGGGSTVFAHGSTGSTETIDPVDGNVHTLTLDANCTFTLTGPTSGPMCTIELYLQQDGTGSRIVTWPGSVIWPGGTTPTLSTAASAVDRFILETHDGGSSWYAGQVGGGGSSGITIQDEGTPLATLATTLNFVGSGVTASGTGATKTITVTSASTVVMISGGGPPDPVLTSDGLDWVYSS